MKRITIISILTIISTIFNACQETLDLQPQDAVSKETFFSNANDFEQAITGLYSGLRSGSADGRGGTYSGGLYWEVAADVMFFQFSWHNPWFDISRGNVNPNTESIGFIWEDAYKTINWANTIIEQYNIKKDILDEELGRDVIGQAHFVRAIAYLRLTSVYGAVPLVDRILTPSEAKLPRTSVEDITNNLVVPDLDIAIENLGELPYSNLWGRATKQAAMGMKVRALLYIKDYDGTVEAAKTLMDFEKSSTVEFLPDFARIFANDNENNGEILFSIKFVGNGTKQGATNSTPFGPNNMPGIASSGINGSWQASAIAPEFINSFPMSDGLPADESPLYDDNNPWANRGVRFESTFYIGGYSTVNGLPFTVESVGTWNSTFKNDYPFNVNKGFMNENIKLNWTNEDDSDDIILRYTDVLLMYAEAKTELGQVDGSVYEIMDMVRDRAGVDLLPRGLGQSQMREAIRNERKWEFAFEGLRYFDMRRWGVAEEAFAAITSDETYNLGSTKVFASGNYLWPIPQFARDANPNLGQNDGY
ncbi:RagB/SusD family nutrient uptake outer membrane protein [Chryseolinea soli]|uniref:RagB/SusD family nutrient uptake outer membrane protein n=1 Tax=Chryseolinea soli TaxID=2321403 RepID=A0A385SLU5_9BACT|nr:RagB/SusD family nutrient uptake outer membrane protein [Chryseolinea soli]AYB31934.1 RagB/SusD family nutrient uptake outer membrane protein [Chryseolinea soli]